jgi:hypothetical protein
MSPLDEKFQNDATFQSLLSSQRELLNKLNMEKEQQTRREEKLSHKQTNQPIFFEGSRADNFLFSKRLSIGVGIGNDSFVLPDPTFDSDQYTASCYECEDTGKKRPNDASDAEKSKKRRTTLSFLDYLLEKNSSSKPKSSRKRYEYVDSDDDDYGVIVEEVDDEDDEVDEDLEPKLEEVKKQIVTFEGAMGKSQESQQQIHDWDRRMGLKRSHSKTMRMSSRTRKQLRQFLQKDIMQLSSMS